MRAFPGFTGAFYGPRRVCGLLICWDRAASPSTKYQSALAIWPTETYSGLDVIKSECGVGLGVKALANELPDRAQREGFYSAASP